MIRPRTLTMMVYTNGTTSIFHVLRGSLSKAGKSFNAAKAEHVATHEHRGRFDSSHYRQWTAAAATLDAPPVPWQA